MMKDKKKVMIVLDGNKISGITLPSKNDIIIKLYDFVDRVSKGKATSDAEIAVLPEVAKLLLKI